MSKLSIIVGGAASNKLKVDKLESRVIMVGSQPLQQEYSGSHDLKFRDKFLYLSQIKLDKTDVALASRVAKSLRKKINSYGESAGLNSDKYWIWFIGTYLKVSIRQNLLAIIILRRYLREHKIDSIHLIKEAGSMFSIDLYKPGSSGLDNVVAYYIEYYCSRKRLECNVVRLNAIHNFFIVFYYKYIYSMAVHAFRCFNLLADALNAEPKEKIGNVLIVERAARFSTLISNTVKDLGFEQCLKVKQQSYSDVNGKKLNFNPAAAWTNSSMLLINILGASVKKLKIKNASTFHQKYLKLYVESIQAHRNLPKIYEYVVKNVFEKTKPRLLIATDEASLFNRMFFHVANVKKIPSTSIQHGEITQIDYLMIHQERYSDYYIVSSPEAKQNFSEWGSTTNLVYNNINSVGNSIYTGSRKVVQILIAATCMGEAHLGTALEILANKLYTINRNLRLSYKPHPLESIEKYNEIFTQRKIKINLIENQELTEVLRGVDLVISINSSIALDVAMKGIPVVMHNEQALQLTALQNKVFKNYEKINDLIFYIKHIIDHNDEYIKLIDSFDSYRRMMHKESELKKFMKTN